MDVRQLTPLLLYVAVFSTYDDVDPIISFMKLNARYASITCYSHHSCYSHQVDIVWYLNISSNQQEPVEYFTGDSELAYSDYGISIQSTCPAYECQSTLSMPNDEALNNTLVWCAGYTEVCPETKSTSNPVTVVTHTDESRTGMYIETFKIV